MIHLEKGKWLEGGEIEVRFSYKKDIDFSYLGSLAENCKKLSITNESKKLNEKLKNLFLVDNQTQNFSKFKNLEHLELKLTKTATFHTNLFNPFENLTNLRLKFDSMVQLPELSFTKLNKVKEMTLLLHPRAKLNKKHFKGLENLETLRHFNLELDEELDTLAKLKELHIQQVKLNKFSFNRIESIEKLTLINLSLNIPGIKSQFHFKNLKKLKDLEIFLLGQVFEWMMQNEEQLLIHILNGIPNNVEKLKARSSFFGCCDWTPKSFNFLRDLKTLDLTFDQGEPNMESFELFEQNSFPNLEDLYMHFSIKSFSNVFPTQSFRTMKNLKSLMINFEKANDFFDRKNKKALEQNPDYFSLFKEDYFQNLETFALGWIDREDESNTTRTFFPALRIEHLTSMKHLKGLILKDFVLSGVDAEFNYISVGSFNRSMPDNILSFVNLRKLVLEDFTNQIAINEKFLEEFFNLEHLELYAVFKAIDDDVQYLFKTLIKLNKLVIADNRMKTIKSTYFDHLVNLYELDLNNNSIEFIESGAFKNLSNLEQVNLSSNFIKDMKKDVFAPDVKLEKIVFLSEGFKSCF